MCEELVFFVDLFLGMAPVFSGSGLKSKSGFSSRAERLSISSGRRKDEDFLLDEWVDQVPTAKREDAVDKNKEQRASMLKLARMDRE